MAKSDELLAGLESGEIDIQSIPSKLTVLPLRDIVIYPYMIFPVLIGRNSSLKAVAEAVEREKYIFVSAQKDPRTEEPALGDLYQHGTVARVIQILRLPNNLLKVLIEGLFQAKVKRSTAKEDYLEAQVDLIDIKYNLEDKKLQAVIRHTTEQFKEYIKSNPQLPADLVGAFEMIEDPVRKLFFAASNLQTKLESKQKLLQKRFLKQQYFELTSILSSELEMMELEDEIDTKVQSSIQRTQRKFFIQEQIRALQKELGEEDEAMPELEQIREMIEKADLPKEAKEKAEEEFARLKKTPTMSPEFSVNRNYLELLTALPWNQRTDDDLDIGHVKKILDEDHWDLEKPKERILEFIAVLNLAGNLKRQILCLSGPPGVGKTSLARSIARALGRNFIRFSLGGIRDEAEIRGHRRTYIGSMPGKIIQSMKKAGTVNPVILLDEIDKMSMDFRGDPSSALLEVLDPEQNVAFNDHYLEVDYDLSNVLFITTANVVHNIPLPLQDRMEIIQLSSYLEPDKIQIAKRHIIPKIKKEFGLEKFNINIQDSAIHKMIREYTRESGVRNLEREISSVLRKLSKEIVEEYDFSRTKKESRKKALKDNPSFNKKMSRKKIVVTPQKVEDYLKAPRFKDRKEKLQDKVGVATGLAWTSVGGEILPIEVNIMPGHEKLTLTGKLGEVMQESAKAALSFVRTNFAVLGIPEKFYEKKEIHIHVPEGAIPKDGPSAGIAMTMALISAAGGKALRGDVAMTGEINLRGEVLPIGGLNEKLLAAKRLGIKHVLIPFDNERDIRDMKKEITDGLNIHPVEKVIEALPVAFRKKPEPMLSKKREQYIH